jgi:peptide chain release factor 3
VVNPLKTKQLRTGLLQLGEEGAIQVFPPLRNTMMLLGAIGSLQFEVAATAAARIRRGSPHGARALHLRALDFGRRPGRVRQIRARQCRTPRARCRRCAGRADQHAFEMKVIQDRFPEIRFHKQREHAGLMADRIADLAK